MLLKTFMTWAENSCNWVAMQFHLKNGLRSDQRPRNTIQVKVTRDHLKHRTTARSGPFTSARLDITLHLGLQIWNAFQPCDKFRSQPTIQKWNKPGRTSTKLSCVVDFEGARNPERQIIWPTNIQTTQQQNQTAFPTSKVCSCGWNGIDFGLMQSPGINDFSFGTVVGEPSWINSSSSSFSPSPSSPGLPPKGSLGKLLVGIGNPLEGRDEAPAPFRPCRWTGIGWRPCSTVSMRFDIPSGILSFKDDRLNWLTDRRRDVFSSVSNARGAWSSQTRLQLLTHFQWRNQGFDSQLPTRSSTFWSHYPYGQGLFHNLNMWKLELQLPLDQCHLILESPNPFAQTKGCLVLGLARLVQGFKLTLQVLDLLTCPIMDFLGNTSKMQRTSWRFVQKTLSFCYNCPKILRTNSNMNCLSSLIMQMQHLGGGWLGYTLKTWKALWSTNFQVTGTPLGWIHWSQSSPMCVFDGQRFTLTIFALLPTLCPVEEADELLLPAPATNAGTSIVWWQIQKWRTWISWTRWHQHPSQNQPATVRVRITMIKNCTPQARPLHVKNCSTLVAKFRCHFEIIVEQAKLILQVQSAKEILSYLRLPARSSTLLRSKRCS